MTARKPLPRLWCWLFHWRSRYFVGSASKFRCWTCGEWWGKGREERK